LTLRCRPNRRFFKIGLILIVAACITPLGTVFMTEPYGAWPMLIPVVLAILGVVAFICHSAHTPLSNTAVRRTEHWRAFRRYLRDICARS
jgi:predicted membrane channel-forming protein YqfA (hemolysin III family)